METITEWMCLIVDDAITKFWSDTWSGDMGPGDWRRMYALIDPPEETATIVERIVYADRVVCWSHQP